MQVHEPGRFGLKEETVEKINTVFAAYPEIEQVILYGSRAKGNYRHGSDIDLVIQGERVTHTQLFQMENQLDDLLLPYKIDLSLLHAIDSLDLLDHIERVGKVFYARQLAAA
jgi:predicted nucleotidyltransferase